MPESVWDYPRPPALVPEPRRLRVVLNGETIAETTRGYAVKETSHPPTFYFPQSDVAPGMLEQSGRRSICEFKGVATYWSVNGEPDAAWSYPDPTPAFAVIREHVAFYPSKMDSCWVGDEQVMAQVGDFYSGWITSDVSGPFKGAPWTSGW